MDRTQLIRKIRELTSCALCTARDSIPSSKADNYTNDDLLEALRKIDIAVAQRAEKQARKEVKEGRVETYTHFGHKLAVMVEVNCETHTASKTEDFKEFCRVLAMQIAAMAPQYKTRDEVPDEVVEEVRYRLLNWAMSLAGDASFEARQEMANTKLENWFAEVCLMEQRFVQDHSKCVEDWRAELAAKLGEDVIVRRWARWEIGEDQ